MFSEGLGNTLIRYNDKWRGVCYLTDNLAFTVDKSKAGRFYLLKPSDTLILNGDRISINCGNRTLTVSDQNKVAMTDRELIARETSTFVITNGLDSTEAVTYDTPFFLLSGSSDDKGLCYIHPGFQTPSYLGNAVMNSESINTYTFFLERADDTITNKVALNTSAKKQDESYRNAILVVSLFIILMLTIVLNKA